MATGWDILVVGVLIISFIAKRSKNCLKYLRDKILSVFRICGCKQSALFLLFNILDHIPGDKSFAMKW